MLKQGYKSPAIAAELGYHASTIRREINRNRMRGEYNAVRALERYTQRRKACHPKGKLACEPLREVVIRLLNLSERMV